MQYLGGKSRIAKRLVAFLESLRAPGQMYVEPFIGGASVFAGMAEPKLGCDIHDGVVQLMHETGGGRVMPDTIDEDEYASIRAGCDDAALSAFVEFACSFGGKSWGGYARSSAGDYAGRGSRGLCKKAAGLSRATLASVDYKAIRPRHALIYCDPPYRGTTGYGVGFSNDEFWSVARSWVGAGNKVVVSEYEAPDDFLEVLSFPHTRGLDRVRVSERVFMHESQAVAA